MRWPCMGQTGPGLNLSMQEWSPTRSERIGHLPVGRGVLGLPLDHASVLRLDDLTTHPAAVGFPEHHPRMHAFLAVPITIRGTVVASLYLTDDRPSQTFAPIR